MLFITRYTHSPELLERRKQKCSKTLPSELCWAVGSYVFMLATKLNSNKSTIKITFGLEALFKLSLPCCDLFHTMIIITKPIKM